MTSNMPYTYEDVSAALAGTGKCVWWPRPNTKVVNHPSGYASVYLHGGLIAELRRDGKVEVHADPDMSNTTRNRLNDVLAPLGWKIMFRADPGNYEYKRPVVVAIRNADDVHTYKAGMVLLNITKGN